MFLVGQEGVGRGRKEEDWGGVDWIWTPAAAAAERECLCAQRREPLQIGVSVVRDSGESCYVAADLVLSTASFPAPPWNSCRTSLASTGFLPSTSPCMGQQNSGFQFGYRGLSPTTRVCFCHMAAQQRFVERYEHSHFAQLAGLTFQTSPTVPLEQFLKKYQTVDFAGLVTTEQQTWSVYRKTLKRQQGLRELWRQEHRPGAFWKRAGANAGYHSRWRYDPSSKKVRR